MPDLIFFFGRFHVLALHLPIGMVFVAIALDWLARSRRRAALATAVPFVWGATALSAVVTVALGYMHFAEGGFTGPSAAAHRLYGTLLALACLAVWLFSAKQPVLHRRFSILTGIVLLGLVTMTGHYGGNLTHGSAYLLEYAPQPLRAVAGLSERRPPVTDLAAADPWHDIVAPLLEARCASCHNADKRSGELSVVGYEPTLAGGETGSVIVRGNAERSELMRRITLPDNDEAFMPAEGKTPLTADQVEILRWWIDAGAPIDTTVAEVGVPDDIDARLRVEVGLDGHAGDSAEPGDAARGSAIRSGAAPMAGADSAVVDALFDAGFLARQVSQSDARLVVSVHSVGTQLDAGQLEVLRAAADTIVDLDLQAAGLDDAALDGFEAFTALETLKLSRNTIGDAGVRRLARLPQLRMLNLYANPAVTDDSLEALAATTHLEMVYLWGTSVSPAGIERLRAQHPALNVQAGWSIPPVQRTQPAFR